MTRTIDDQIREKEIELKARMIKPKYLVIGISTWPRLLAEIDHLLPAEGLGVAERYRGMFVLIHPTDRYIIDVVGCPET